MRKVTLLTVVTRVDGGNVSLLFAPRGGFCRREDLSLRGIGIIFVH